MKKMYFFLLTFLSLSGSIPKKRSERHLKEAIQTIYNKADKKTKLGIKVVSLSDQQVLYERNGDQPFVPASNTKLVTSEAALHILGPDFQFKTFFISKAPPVKGTIDALYIKGSGDPSLKAQDLEKLVIQLKKKGIKTISGNLIVDASVFDAEGTGPGWRTGDGPIFDKAPTAGLMAHHSCITVRVKPARVIGRKPVVTLDPAVGFPIDNRARTVGPNKKNTLRVTRDRSNRFIITGILPLKTRAKTYRIAVAHPELFAGSIVRMLLKKHGIHFTGQVLLGTIPSRVYPLAQHTSAPLSSLIRFLMKRSDNLYADALYKKMGAALYKTPGTWAKGKKAVETFLKERVGMVPHTFVLDDGGGLSHNNRLSPNHLMQLLLWIYTQSPYKKTCIDSLPISGVDGTLRNRMKAKKTKAKIKAKTGTLNGVTSLSGFIIPQKGKKLAFVMMANKPKASIGRLKTHLEDHVCTLLATHAFSTS